MAGVDAPVIRFHHTIVGAYMTIVKRATMKYPDGHVMDFALVKRERVDFRWIYAASGEEVSGVAYLSEPDAIKALRVQVDHSPELVGVDLTITSVDPPPEQRAAEAVWSRYEKYDFVDRPLLRDREVEALAEIIGRETGVPALIESFSNLMAYVFIHRPAFAKALFPVTAQGNPRDMVLDGLLWQAVEAMQKSTGQDFSNLLKPLKEPVSQIMTAKAMPKKGSSIQ